MPPEPIVHVIDDDDAVRQSLEFLLRTAGIAVRGFESAKAFLEVLPQIRSGCIITDVRMPEISGIDLLRRVKRGQIPSSGDRDHRPRRCAARGRRR